MKRISRYALPLLVTAAAGCGLFDSSGGNNDGGGGTAYTSPTLEVTINGIHFGPSAPTSGSGASLINTRDSTGRVTSSVFRMVAASSLSGATCNVSAQRSGNEVAPIGQGGYTFTPQLGTPQYDGVAPIDGESVAVSQGTFQCTGQACNGTVFAITRMSDTMIEGYVAGNWADSNGSFLAPVVCSFYVPLTSYVP